MKEPIIKPSRSALRRQRDKEYRYQSILNAAEKLFAEKGYHQTSMEQIGDLSEVSAATVYSYFRNKEDLLLTAMRKSGYEFRKMIGDAFGAADHSMDGLKNAGLSFFRDFCLKHPEKAIILFREAVGQGEEVEDQRKKLFMKMALDIKNALLKLSDNIGFKYESDRSAEIMAVSIVGIYAQIACHYMIWDDSSCNLMDIADSAVAFTIGGVSSLISNEKSKPN
ncbi:MAG: TetR/AcrR family transcriptional regulator [Proteobacteria bacterium]|nr:TetR/AcrR family transcriptional regulator [Pseudomonadota bacterium]